MKAGDIVIVHYPFTDLIQIKIRPAVVVAISDDKYKDVILCLISSVVQKKLNTNEILLQPTVINSLRKPSIIKIYRIATIQQTKIVSEIGRLTPKELKSFIAAFQSLPK